MAISHRRMSLTHLGLAAALAGLVAVGIVSVVGGSTEQGDLPVLHVVTVVEPATNGMATVDTWIDQETGDAVVREYDQEGRLTFITARQGLSLSLFDVELGSLTVQTALTEDDPMLRRATDQLDRYKVWLEQGLAVSHGSVDFHGYEAIEVTALVGTEMEHTAYLDPSTYYPLGADDPKGEYRAVFVYPTIEQLPRDSAVEGAFEVDTSLASTVERNDRLSATAVSEFASYPLESLGVQFNGYELSVVNHYSTQGYGSADVDAVYFIYRVANAVDGHSHDEVPNEIQVISRGPLTDAELAGLAEAEAGGALEVATTQVVGDQELRVRKYGGGVRLEIPRPEGFTFLWAPDEATAFAAFEALKPVI